MKSRKKKEYCDECGGLIATRFHARVTKITIAQAGKLQAAGATVFDRNNVPAQWSNPITIRPRNSQKRVCRNNAASSPNPGDK